MTTVRVPLSAESVKERLDERAVQAVLEHLGVEKFTSNGADNWFVSAPYREDRHPSCSVHRASGVFNDKATGDRGDLFELVMKTCAVTLPVAVKLVADLAGIRPNGQKLATRAKPATQIVESYSYVDEHGEMLYDVDRFSDKTFKPRLSDGRRSYGNRRILYRLPELLASGTRWVFLLEGEKDVDRAWSEGIVATTSPGGSNGWKTEYTDSLRGRRIVIVPDNDDPGWKYAHTIARDLHGVASEIRIIELPGLGARLPKGGKDLSDWLDAGHSIDELKDLVQNAREWKPTEIVEAVTEPGLIIKSMEDVEARPIDWIWTRWLARRKIHLLGGHAGEGKSLLTTALAARMSDRGRLPDGETVTPVRTLFLLAEDDVADTVKPRLSAHHARMDHIFSIEAVREPDKPRAAFSLAKHLSLLEDAVREHQIDLLIIDPLSAFLQGSERNSEEVRDLLTPLADLAAQTDIAVLGIMHIGKPNGTNRRPLQQLLGATAFGAVARVVWMLAADDEDDGDDRRLVLGVVKSNISFVPASYALMISDVGGVSFMGQSDKSISELLSEQRKRTSSISPERQDILTLLERSTDPLSPAQIAEALQKNASTVKNLLRKMEEDRQVVRPWTGVYAIPAHKLIDSVDQTIDIAEKQEASFIQRSTESMKSTDYVPRDTVVSHGLPTDVAGQCAWCKKPTDGRRLCEACANGEDVPS